MDAAKVIEEMQDKSVSDCGTMPLGVIRTLEELKKPQLDWRTILNDFIQEEVNDSMRAICEHYGVQLIELHDIDKQNGHPSISGMKAICDQLLEAIK